MDTAAEIAVLKDKLLGRVPRGDGVGCILCLWILEDLVKNGTLTKGHPRVCFDGKPVFPVEGKLAHLVIEGFLEKKQTAGAH